jgi:hypothetical protein
MGLHDVEIIGTSIGAGGTNIRWLVDYVEARLLVNEDGEPVAMTLALGQPTEPLDVDDAVIRCFTAYRALDPCPSCARAIERGIGRTANCPRCGTT